MVKTVMSLIILSLICFLSGLVSGMSVEDTYDMHNRDSWHIRKILLCVLMVVDIIYWGYLLLG